MGIRPGNGCRANPAPVTFWRAVLAALLLGACLVGPDPGGARAAEEDAPLLVFAAASTTNALQEIAAGFEARGGGKVVLSLGASSALARQIENGAPAGVYLAANVAWMDYLEARGLVVPESRRDLVRNRLVLIAPAESDAAPVDIGPGLDLAARLGRGRLALGDPDHVPAGIYAKQALEALGLWRQVADRVARSADVRMALALVERGEAELGVVYASDAVADRKVKVLGVLPEESHAPIVYPAALVAGNDGPRARAFLEFLGGDAAREIFRSYGFLSD